MFSRSELPTTEPPWFAAALNQKPDHRDIQVGGRRIHLRAWGSAAHPPVVLVHGGAAHSGWWDHIAPFISQTHRVVALDLSGHGDSDASESYDLPTWAREVIEVVAAAGASGRPTIVGHSMGGWVAATAAMLHGEEVNSVVVIDSPMREYVPEASRLRGRERSRYRSRQDILSRFRPVPAQTVVLPYIQRHIAAESVRRAGAGWVWKFDAAIFDGEFLRPRPADEESLEKMFAQLRCRIGYLRCEAGVVQPAMAQRIRDTLQLRGPFVELAEAGHHPMLDQPLPLVATLRTLLEFWSIT